jgi:RND family efflux transporter MFP subunit
MDVNKGLGAMKERKKRVLYIGIAIAILALGVVGMGVLIASKPEIERHEPVAPIPVVRIINAEVGPQSVLIKGEGTVRPLREITLMPEVDGKVVYISPTLVDGGEFRKGDTLLRIDPVDYQLAVTLAKAKVKDSESNLKLAEEEAAAAREEWYLDHVDVGDSTVQRKPPPLVAREPQLAAARAKLEADQADFRKALLNLERTELKAPFDGRVSEENVDIGQYVSVGQALATLYSTEAAEIVVPLRNEDLFWFHVPGFTPGNSPGSPAEVLARIAGREQSWLGEVVRTEGKLDERTRMINVVIRVEKPYAKKPPLAVGLFVKVDIQGRTLPNATIIPRSALHQDNVVWVVDEHGRLQFHKVDVARVQGDEVMVEAGLKDGEKVVISPLKAVTDGMVVHTKLVKEEAQL